MDSQGTIKTIIVNTPIWVARRHKSKHLSKSVKTSYEGLGQNCFIRIMRNLLEHMIEGGEVFFFFLFKKVCKPGVRVIDIWIIRCQNLHGGLDDGGICKYISIRCAAPLS